MSDSAAPAAAPVVDVAAVRQTIEQTNAKLVDGLQRGDTAAMSSVYADDAVVMMSEQPAWRGRAEITKNGAAMFSRYVLSNVKFTPASIDVTDSYAIETGTYEMTVTPNGGSQPTIDKGKYLSVWKKQADGSWKVYRDISNTDLPR